MTKRVDRPHKKRGRALAVPPAHAAARIAALAATGHSVVGIARQLRTSGNTLRRWMDEDPALAEALAQGREAERFTLHNVLYRAAKKGNIVAAMFLLKARHGYKEGDQSEAANKVSINFTLPAPLPADQFQAIEHEAGDNALPLSRARTTRA
jgi:lambda repressor-like predicted transcriptional regulator